MKPTVIDDLIGIIKKCVDDHRLAPGCYARFLWNNPEGTRKMGPNEYGCADAANILYTIGQFPQDPAERAEWVRHLQEMQDPETGMYSEPTHHTIHTTAHCTAALELFDAAPVHPCRGFEKYTTKEGLYRLLEEELPWDSPWPGSHQGAGILPSLTKGGIKTMSVNLLLEDPSAPVVWRGPVIAGAVQQFWKDVLWGDVDFMFIDMPPGTGDVALTVFQSIPLDGLIIVTTPQDLVTMIVEKAVNMAKLMEIPVLGLVENMSYVECPDCGKKLEIFGKSHVEETALAFGIPHTARMPIDPAVASIIDAGDGDNLNCTALNGIMDAIEQL